MRKDQRPSHDLGAAVYDHRVRERARKYVPKKAAKLGYTLALASLVTQPPELFLSTRLLEVVPRLALCPLH
jgi:hypothetical protein